MSQANHSSANSLSPAFVLGLSISLALLIGIFRPAEGDVSEMTRDEFWRSKVDQPAVFDMVLAGDSRVLCDLSPAVMQQLLKKKILNFGFNFVGYDEGYLQAIESKLDVRSKDKVIVLGITPRAFTPLNMKASGYTEEAQRDSFEKFSQRYLSGFTSIFRPVMLSSIILHLQGKSATKNFYRNGLMTVSIRPPSDAQESRTYKKIFLNNKIDQVNVSRLLQAVKKWRGLGVRVVAFRPPVSDSIHASEEALSGFDQASFIKDFSRAGGQWLEVASKDLTLADGSHVIASDVPEFSKRLAVEIQRAH